MKLECIKIEQTKQQHNLTFQQVENGKQVAAIQFATMSLATAQQFVPGGFYEIKFTEVAAD